jgi:hypothetical protein
MNLATVNPIKFYTNTADFYSSEGAAHRYFQKYQTNDVTKIQIISENDNDNSAWTMRVEDCRGVSQNVDIPVTIVGDVIEGYDVVEFFIAFNQFADGCYKFIISNSALDVTLFSDLIDIADEHEGTMLLSYNNSENSPGTAFSTGIIFNLRVEAQGKKTPKSLRPQANETIYDNTVGGYALLHSDAYDNYNYNFGGIAGIPDYLTKIVNYSLSCDFLLIDGHQACKAVESTFEAVEADNYPYRSWNIEMAVSDSVQSSYYAATWSDFVCLKVSDIQYTTATWSNFVCLKEEQTLQWISATWSNFVCLKEESTPTTPISISLSIRQNLGTYQPTFVWETSENINTMMRFTIELEDIGAMVENVEVDININALSGSYTYKDYGGGELNIATTSEWTPQSINNRQINVNRNIPITKN